MARSRKPTGVAVFGASMRRSNSSLRRYMGRLWRIFGDPTQVASVLTKGAFGVAAPRLVSNLAEVVYSLDDQKHLWRAEGTGVADVTPNDSATADVSRSPSPQVAVIIAR